MRLTTASVRPVRARKTEERVLVAVRDKLMRPDLFEDFCREYVRESDRLRLEHCAGVSSARTDIQAIKDDVAALSIKDELLSLEARKAELQSRLEAPKTPGAAAPAHVRRLSREGRQPLSGAGERRLASSHARSASRRAVVEQSRLERARHYLEGTQLSVSEVAQCCGYTTAEGMRLAFDRHLGVSPREYRRRFASSTAM